MPTLSLVNVTTTELLAVETAQENLPEGELKSALGAMLRTIRTGDPVYVAGPDDIVTTTEAARILGVSRPHLYKILDSGALEFEVVGKRDRRIRVADLVVYRDRLRDARRDAAAAVAAGDERFDALVNEMM
jgi:excisionase family DNA binding protein